MRYTLSFILFFLLMLCMNTAVLAQKSDFMHNVTPDDSVKTIAMRLLLEEKQKEECFDATGTMEGRSGDEAAYEGVIKLAGENIVMSPRSVLSVEDVNLMANQTVRFFVWIKGDGIIARDYQLEKVPTLIVEVVDDFGNQLVNAKSSFHTRGSFPWHCYYVDVKFPNFTLTKDDPKSAAKTDKKNDDEIEMLLMSDSAVSRKKEKGLYIGLSNFGGGTAYFAGVSYVVLPGDGALPRNKKVNAYYGSCSPNPGYDDLASHIFFGIDRNLKWRFLDQQHLKALKTPNGIRDYVKKNGRDWFHLQYGISKLPYVMYCVSQYKLSQPFDEACGEALLEEVNGLQDPKTGLWKVGGVPNLLASAAIVRGIYSPKSFAHGDMKAISMPWNGATDGAQLRYADKIVASLIGSRVSRQIPAWNELAFQKYDFLVENGVRVNVATLDSTVAAMVILSRALEQLPGDSKPYKAGSAALKEAYFYCLENFLTIDGTWKENNVAKRAGFTSADFMQIFECTPILESTRQDGISNPAVYANTKAGSQKPEFSFKWNGKGDNLQDIRIYCVTEGTDVTAIKDSDLVGIMNKGVPSSPSKGDPFLLVRHIVGAAAMRGKMTPADCDAPYVNAKMKEIPQVFGVGRANIVLDITVPSRFVKKEGSGDSVTYTLEQPVKFYACSVNAYGGVSEMVPVTMLDAKPSEEESEGEATPQGAPAPEAKAAAEAKPAP